MLINTECHLSCYMALPVETPMLDAYFNKYQQYKHVFSKSTVKGDMMILNDIFQWERYMGLTPMTVE